jgi:hypothetical protein
VGDDQHKTCDFKNGQEKLQGLVVSECLLTAMIG